MLITEIWSNQPGKYFCLSTRHKNHSKDQPLKDHWFEEYQFDQVAKKVKSLRDDYNVWFCPHGFNRKRRRQKYAEPSAWFYADLDPVDPNTTPVKPSAALESSPGRYVGFWYMGKPITWEQNRAWTHLIGADKGGWDPTQVLRAPLSFNHKVEYNKPRVKTLWHNTRPIKEKRIIPLLPEVKEKKSPSGSAIFKKWEKKIPVRLRREILAKEQTVEDRSKWIWSATKTLQSLGMTSKEIYALLWNSGNNKWFNKRTGPKRLRTDIKNSLDDHFKREPQEIEDDEGMFLFSKSMAEVEQEEIDWIWEPYVARGELTIIEGDPGVGKSWLAQMLGIAIADGKKMPTDARFKQKDIPPSVVLFLDHENSRATVMKQRLRTNGLQNEDLFYQEDFAFSVDNEEAMEALYNAIERLKPALVVFDTLMNYAGGANVYNPAETAQMFGTFRHIALEYGCATAVVRHLTKSNKERATYRGQGSITFTGTARCVIGVGYSPDDPIERLFKIVKTNIIDPDSVGARRFKLIPRPNNECEFEFGDTLHITNEDLYNQEKPKPEDDTELLDFLAEELTRPRLEKALVKAALGRFDDKMLQRGLQKVGAKPKNTPKGRKWFPRR